jgi:hypothetical protein
MRGVVLFERHKAEKIVRVRLPNAFAVAKGKLKGPGL